MEGKSKNSKYFYISFALYGISFITLPVCILGAGSSFGYDTTNKVADIVLFYVLPFQILGLIFTGIGASKSLSFNNKKDKKLGRIGLIYGFTCLLLFCCTLGFIIGLTIVD